MAFQPGGHMGKCPHDGAPAVQSARYPDALCLGCMERTCDLEGRLVDMGNENLTGGLVAVHRDDRTPCDQVTSNGEVLIDGKKFRAAEAYMGGIVIRPLR